MSDEEEEKEHFFRIKPPPNEPTSFFSCAPRTLVDSCANKKDEHLLIDVSDIDDDENNTQNKDEQSTIQNTTYNYVKNSFPLDHESTFQIHKPHSNDFQTQKETETELSYESFLLDIKTQLSDLDDKLKIAKNECTQQNQIKLSADIHYLREMMNCIKTNIKTTQIKNNDIKKKLDILSIPPNYADSMSRLTKNSKKKQQYVFDQIEALCHIIENCSNENFKECASSTLADKTRELQQVLDQKENLLAELSLLRDQFAKQEDFVIQQIYQQNKRNMKRKLIRQYYEDMQTISLSSFHSETKYIQPSLPHPPQSTFGTTCLPPIARNKGSSIKPHFSLGLSPRRSIRGIGMSLASSHGEGAKTARTHSYFRMKHLVSLKPLDHNSFLQENEEEDTQFLI